MISANRSILAPTGNAEELHPQAPYFPGARNLWGDQKPQRFPAKQYFPIILSLITGVLILHRYFFHLRISGFWGPCNVRLEWQFK
jgi:hypothetical protein